jgi:nucleotide-binding universal stress UspA family protein
MGPPSSRTALGWAARQAKLTGAVVDAMTAWHFPPGYAWAPDGLAAVELAAAARQQLTEAVGEVAGAEPAAEIRPRVVAGPPGPALVEAARGADLLVVGSRGHGGFTGALLGSVSSHCVHHAPCPVLVIRGEAQQARQTVRKTKTADREAA